MPTSHIQTLRAMLREEKGVILPGAPNALAARIIADLGFRAVYLTGAGLAARIDRARRELSDVPERTKHEEVSASGSSRRARGFFFPSVRLKHPPTELSNISSQR